MENIMWRQIRGYEGYYDVSNVGTIRSTQGRIVRRNGHTGDRIWNEKPIKAVIGKDGRERVVLSKDGVMHGDLVSRIVALNWVDGYRDGLTVNHINGNKLDDRIENLEWVTREDNIRIGYKTGLYRKKQIPVVITNLSTGEKIQFASLSEADRFFGKCIGCLSGVILKQDRKRKNLIDANNNTMV